MPDYYLRIEGVNLSQFVDDTADLSTIRGGGLALLQAPGLVRQALTRGGRSVETIIEGGSVGLYRVTATCSSEDLRAEARTALKSGVTRYASVMVEVAEEAEFNATTKWGLTAKCRWSQMQAATVQYPALSTSTPAVCTLDLVRPAAFHDPRVANEKKQWHSTISHARREFGQIEKQAIYRSRFDPNGPVRSFAEDFDQIAGSSKHWGNLENKLAVLYLDGNRFGARQQRLSQDRQAEFSRRVREIQEAAIRALLLEKIDKDQEWRCADRVRLEVLLWGGDEVVLVMPAWKGWEAAQFLLEKLSADRQEPFSEDPLTWTASLIFCHQDAPIRRVRQLATNLVEHVKTEVAPKGSPHYSKNLLLYQVLESFDDIGRYPSADFFRARHAFLPRGDSSTWFNNTLVLEADHMQTVLEIMNARADIPRRKLIEIVRELSNSGTIGTLKPGIREPATERLVNQFGESYPLAHWYHIAELWDYVSPMKREEHI